MRQIRPIQSFWVAPGQPVLVSPCARVCRCSFEFISRATMERRTHTHRVFHHPAAVVIASKDCRARLAPAPSGAYDARRASADQRARKMCTRAIRRTRTVTRTA